MFKGPSGISYTSEAPLGAETDWVVFPMVINTKEKNYGSALKLAHEVCRKAADKLTVEDSLPCNLLLLDFDTSYKNYKATIDLKQHSHDEFEASVSQYAVLKFDAKGAFWQKAVIIAQVLDKLVAFSNQYRNDKRVNIDIIEGKHA
ncbi:hypothetical protein QUF76_14160 [Desulfobacterales bacterium HSG16]|nr:hypothetical protein [Desulfobacterales bacterium HSG16]